MMSFIHPPWSKLTNKVNILMGQRILKLLSQFLVLVKIEKSGYQGASENK